MKIGIYAPEYLNNIRAALKFYHPQGWSPSYAGKLDSSRDVTSFIIFAPQAPAQEEDRSELGESAAYEYRQILDIDGLSEIKDAINSGEISLLLFDSLHSHQLWASAQELESQTLYLNARFKILEAPIQAIKTCPWLSLHNLSYCKLRGEDLQAEPNIIVHETAAHWQEDPESILITHNQALISYLLKAKALDSQVLHLENKIPMLNCNLLMINPELREERIHNMLGWSEHILKEAGTLKLDGSVKSGDGGFTNSAYSFFARIYDDYMSHVDYDLWIRSISKWQKKYGEKKAKKILEIACGTANVGGLLVFDGYQVDACDSSWQMLSEADGKLFKPRLFLRSMTEALPELNYDLVLCLFDSINYLQKKTEIKALLESVSKALRPGGLFIFDISTLFNSLENFADNINLTRDSSGYLVHHAEYEEYSTLQKSHLYHFRKNFMGFELESENHIQRVYRNTELLQMIESSPFKLIALHATETPQNLINKRNSPLDEKYPRLFFVLQRGD